MTGLAIAFAFAMEPRCLAQTVSLGAAAQYGVFEASGGNGTVNLSNNALITGNLGVGNGTAPNISNSAAITGTTSILTSGAQANTDAKSASTTAAGLKATESVSGTGVSNNAISLSNNQALTVSGTAGVNVINLNSISLSNNSTLTISGTGSPSQIFVFNISGSVSLANNTSIKLQGISASQVIFNIDSKNSSVSLSNSATASGTFLDLNGRISMSNNTEVTGALISEQSISMSNSATVNAQPFVTHAPEMPTIALAGFACVAGMLIRMAAIQRAERPIALAELARSAHRRLEEEWRNWESLHDAPTSS